MKKRMKHFLYLACSVNILASFFNLYINNVYSLKYNSCNQLIFSFQSNAYVHDLWQWNSSTE